MNRLKRMATPVAALAAVAALAVPWYRPPGAAAVAAATGDVSFARRVLPAANDSTRTERVVAPALRHIGPWISAVGASVGALDLRRQGFDADACLTDPRDDEVHVFPVPGSKGIGFAPFTLRPDGLPMDSTMAPIGCVPTDVNQDGWTDVVVYYWGRSPVLFINVNGRGTPSPTMFRAEELVSPMQVWNTTALNFADVDGDGLLDILVGNYFPDGARVLDPKAADDARMQMQHSMGAAHNAGTNRLFLGAREGGKLAFTDATTALPDESARSWTLAIGFQKLSGPKVPDVYVANDFGPDQLLVNTSTPGHVRLTSVTGRRVLDTSKSKVLGNDSFKGMGVAFSYEHNQYLPRIFVSNITSPWALQESNLAFYPDGDGSQLLRGSVPYRERSTQAGIAHSGWSWDIKPVDVDNSGRDWLVQATGFLRGQRDMWPRLQEMAMGNDQILQHPEVWVTLREGDDLSGHEPDRLWAPVGDQFVDAGARAGFSTEDVTRGFAVTDFDDDGRLDLVAAEQWGDSYSFQNQTPSRNPSLTIRPVRPAAHGAATLYGATVQLRYGDEYFRTAQLFPGNGHSGVSGSSLHFALPPAPRRPDHVLALVAWPEGGAVHQQTFDIALTGEHTSVTLEVKP